MVKHKITYAMSAAVLLAGAGFFGPAVFADGECEASTIEELESCLSGDAASVVTTDTIVVSGEGVNKVLVVDRPITGAAGLDMFEVKDGARLTFRGNSTITAGRYFAVANGADLIIDGPSISATSNASYGVYARDNGHVYMESGQLVADYAAFAGNNTTGDMNFYINGGLLKSNRYPAIYMPGQVELLMRGGTLDGGIVARMGQITIEGGTINQQATPVSNDGLDVNYNGMPSIANEAVTLVAGSYTSSTTSYGNSMNVLIGGNARLNGDIVLYDLGNTADGYQQNVSVLIEDGYLKGVKTKFTEDEIGFNLKKGYTAGLNNDAGRINVAISGGNYMTEPDEEDLIPGYETEYNEEEGVYEIWPSQVDYSNWFIESDSSIEGQLQSFIEFGDKELIADRKASLSATENTDEGLTLTRGGELIGAVDLDMLDRNGSRIEVSDNDLTVFFEIDEETYNMLAKYDKLYAVYFNEDGVEAERYELTLENEEDTWYYFWFKTSHLSTYGVVGVNGEESSGEASEATSNTVSTPETGTMTAAGASALSATLVTAIIVGILTSVVSFIALFRRFL